MYSLPHCSRHNQIPIMTADNPPTSPFQLLPKRKRINSGKRLKKKKQKKRDLSFHEMPVLETHLCERTVREKTHAKLLMSCVVVSWLGYVCVTVGVQMLLRKRKEKAIRNELNPWWNKNGKKDDLKDSLDKSDRRLSFFVSFYHCFRIFFSVLWCLKTALCKR